MRHFGIRQLEEIITKITHRWVGCEYTEFVIIPLRNNSTDFASILLKGAPLLIDFLVQVVRGRILGANKQGGTTYSGIVLETGQLVVIHRQVPSTQIKYMTDESARSSLIILSVVFILTCNNYRLERPPTNKRAFVSNSSLLGR